MRKIMLAAAVAATVLHGPARSHDLSVQPAEAPAAQPLPIAPNVEGSLPTPEDGYFQVPEQVTEGVWLLRQPRFQVQPIGNVAVIEQADGLVLVDSGGSPGAGRRIVDMVREISPKPVKAVVITHWHGDHPQGLSAILEAWPNARTIATVQTQTHLVTPATMNTPGAPDPARNAAFQQQIQGFVGYIRQMGANARTDYGRANWAAGERLMNQYALDMDGALTLPVQEGVADRLVIDDAERPVEVLYLGRANTDGDAVIWLPRQRIVAAGDIVVHPFPYGFGSYPGEWIETFGRLKALGFETLIPGHGPVLQGTAYVDQVIAALEDVRAQVTPLAEAGVPLDQIMSRTDFSAQRTGFVGEDPWQTRWFNDFWLQPIVTAAYREARGEPIIQSLNPG
ncbi:MBL fold metallo-hydrolase [Brevundimonas sp. 2R-24]|uniref:MBL fold metallo-hydrolase n=1 Tax=Peiella sedimenti TaxID=3061083 RepID=A0ABT8SP36_9CAUL|nr:MBL fold metallo-hydrolase [Caulobacteraceae bacterium XZ-24]